MSIQQVLLAYGAASANDPNFANVSLLVHCDGTNGSTTFTDNSSQNHTVTVNGSAQVTTTTVKYGTGGLNPNGGHLQVTSSTDLDLTTGDWTIECWFYLTAATTVCVLMDKESANGQYPWSLITNSPTSTKMSLRRFNSGGTLLTDLIGTTTITANAWHHAAACRQGDNFYLFLDGNLEASRTDTGAVLRTNSSDPVNLGNNNSNSSGACFMDDIRITKGVARYTANFTPPSAAFPNS